MTKTHTRKLLSAAIAATVTMQTAPVLAQGMLEEVVVTARKREESILKVPVTVSVLSGETIDQYGISNVKDIANMTPGLNFGEAPLSAGVQVSMRGIGTSTNNPTIDQSVALVVDGMQFTQGLAFSAATFDMAQVEVMKGPQALFFGKAAPGGVIAIRTADPGDEAEINLRVGYEFEAKEQLGEMIFSGPVTDTLGLRLAAQFSDAEDYFKNDSVPADNAGGLGALPPKYDDHLSETETVLLRGTALWEPTDRLNARLKLNYNDIDVQGVAGQTDFARCPEGTDSWFGTNVVAPVLRVDPVHFIGGQDCKADDKKSVPNMDPAVFPGIYNGGVSFAELEQYFGSLEFNYDFGNGLTLTSVTGYYDMEQESLTNGSGTTIYGPPFAIQGQFERTDFTQELRLTSSYDGALNFVLGAFYQDGETDYLSHLPANQAYNSFLAALGQPFPPALALADYNIEAETQSLFGQVLWGITSTLELGVGVRWTDEERKISADDLLPAYLGVAPGPIPVMLAKDKISGDNWSPEFSVTWTPTDELTVYGNLKRAYKSGSFDTAGAVADGDDVSFDDEEVNGGEIGLKTRYLDGSLLLNVATYYYEFDDLQVSASVFDPLAGVAGVRTTNAGTAEVYGVDLDVNYALPGLEGFVLYGAVNYNKSEYDEFITAPCYYGQTQSEGCNIDADGDGIGDAQDLSGEPLMRAPEWMANIGFDYQASVFGDMTLRLGANVSYSDDYTTNISNAPEGVQDSYTKTSATVSLSGADDRWSAELIGDNLTDEIVYGKCTVAGWTDTVVFGQDPRLDGAGQEQVGLGGRGEAGCHTERGRAVWLRFTYNFL